MPHNREQHFVPQFYLRYFSKDGKRISLFNFKQNKIITDVSIKQQCSRHNFYNFAPKLEEAFAALEGETAKILRGIKAANTVPAQGTGEFLSLISFIIFQKHRTVGMGYKNDVMTDYLAKLCMEGAPELSHIDLDSIEVKNAYSVALPLSIVGDMIPSVTDLHMHLLINRTPLEFITSDDPVVLHNQYCEEINYRGVNGWACRGLQVFWPISPTELILLYDPKVYKVGDSHKRKYTTNILSEDDIAKLNSLQILNAQNNVYFAGFPNFEKTVQQIRHTTSTRPKARITFVETDPVTNENGEASSLLHSYVPLLPLKLSVSKITIRKKAKRIPPDSRGDLYREDTESPKDDFFDFSNEPPAGVYPVKKIIKK